MLQPSIPLGDTRSSVVYRSRGECLLDLFSFHRTAAGIRAELLSINSSDVMPNPEDYGLVELVGERERTRAVLKSTSDNNPITTDQASQMLDDLAKFVIEFIGGPSIRETVESTRDDSFLPRLPTVTEEYFYENRQKAVSMGLFTVTTDPSVVLAITKENKRKKEHLVRLFSLIRSC